MGKLLDAATYLRHKDGGISMRPFPRIQQANYIGGFFLSLLLLGCASSRKAVNTVLKTFDITVVIVVAVVFTPPLF